MAVFVDNPCKVDLDTLVENVVWSTCDPIAAFATSRLDDNDKEKFQVLFVNNEGGLILNSVITHTAAARVMEWQPNGRVLAIGWSDGMVSCWNVDGKTRPTSTFSGSSQHNSAITVLKWNPAGKRLITGDKSGTVNVWVVDNRGTLTPSRQYRKRSHVTAAVFCVIPPKLDSQRKIDLKKTYSPAFFFGTDRGGVVYADDLGHCTEVQHLSSSIDKMLFFEEQSRLVIITRSLLLTQYHVAEDGRVTRVSQVKLGVSKDVADGGIRSCVWAGPGLLAAATGEKMVRLLDLSSDESYNLSLSMVGDAVDRSDRVMVVAFSPMDRYLAVGTRMGMIIIWKYNSILKTSKEGSGSGIAQGDWELHYKTSLNSPVRNILWSHGQGTLMAVTDSGAIILSEAVMQQGMCGRLSVVQVSTMHVSVHLDLDDAWIENTRILVRGMSVADSSFVTWDGKNALVCTVNLQSHRSTILEPFSCTSNAIVIADSKHISEDALFISENSMVKVTNYGGVQKGSITFSEAEGRPEHLHICGKFLYVVTANFYVKVFDVNKPTMPKLLGSAGRFTDPATGSVKSSKLSIRSIRGNATGSRVAIMTSHVEGSLKVQHPDSRLHIFDRIKGSVNVYDFTHQSRYPARANWDNFDDRLIVVEAVRMQSAGTNSAPGGSGASPKAQTDGAETKADAADKPKATIEGENLHEVVLLFASTEHGILLQDSFPRDSSHGDLLGIAVPNIYFRNAVPSMSAGDGTPTGNRHTVKILAKVMRDFVGVNQIDDATKYALLEFSFNLTLGKLDEAYRAVKAIDSPFIWENMAQMCVKTKRLDVAEVCLGNMGHARGAAALRESMKENSPDVSVGILAIQLGLLDDAARLFREAGRFDLLNTLYQAAGQWEKAISLAKAHDRLHLKTTHYHYAKFLESIGDVPEAIYHFEQSETFRTEIPRMLYSLGQVEELEDYVHHSNDSALLKWWAAYLESKERYDKARKYYLKSGDYLSLVRILCFQGDFQKAADIVQDTKDNAATYHFARQLESQGQLQEAISYYAASGCYNHAIRLAKAYGMDTELMTFAIKSTPSLMLDCATHFEQKGDLEKAVQLYHKGGDYLHALDICFRVGQSGDAVGVTRQQRSAIFDMVNIIAQDLGADTSPQILARCAEFLVMHRQFEKAVELYIMARRYPQAIEMCMQQKVNITEEMAQLLTPPSDGFDSNERKEILANLGRALKKQGSFTLASKKYTQAGDRIRAIKCLLRGGDTKAVIQFASISRNAEIYKLAANYLQQMDWRDGEIMKAIITFYSKAKAYEQLAGFYDSCAQVEIDEYRDYEKAYRALKESMKYLREAKGRHIEEMVSTLESRLSLIERFVTARKCAKKDPDEMVAICENILEEPQLDMAIRVGDCLAMLVEHFHHTGDMRRAYQYMLDMKERRILLHPYIDAEVLDDVHRAVGVPLDDDKQDDDVGSDRDEDEIVEEVDEVDDEIEEEKAQFNRSGRYGGGKYRK